MNRLAKRLIIYALKRQLRRREPMSRALLAAGGLGLGAAAMYVLDPDRGRRRRAMARDWCARAWHQSGDAFGKTSRDLGNRARGLAAKTGSLFKNHDAADDVLTARVRSKLGRVVAHPHAVHVEAQGGCVTLHGPVLAHEVEELLSCVSQVPGVHEVRSQLEVHERAGDVPGLQGGRRRTGEDSEFAQRNWSPGARALAGVGGGALLAWGLGRRDLLGGAVGAVGACLLTRGVTNLETRRLVGIGGGRRAIDFRKTININAPVEEVFKFWENYANFPHIMSNVREVRDLGNGRSHWAVAGPAGFSVEWDAEVTKRVPNEVLAWKSVPGSTVENAGMIQFSPNGRGGTRLDVRMSYNPPAGAIGHAFATLFGANPKREMDEDLLRAKTMIETGRPPRDAAARGATAHHEAAHQPAQSS